MQENIRIQNNATNASIDIEGIIGVPEAWQFDDPAQRVATYEAFSEAVRRIGELDATHIVVNIRSTGGDVNDALLIYDALTALSAHITTRCYGYTASAATIIAQAATEGSREISPNALYLIHNSICATEGNADELEAHLDLLRRTDERLAALYAQRSERTVEEFALLMAENSGSGRWLSPTEAIEAGLVDVLINQETQPRPSITRNIVRGWQRLTQRIGIATAPLELPTDRNNILHFDDDNQLQVARSVIAAQDAQQNILPTAIQPSEDPSVQETLHTTNERAYMADAKRFSKF